MQRGGSLAAVLRGRKGDPLFIPLPAAGTPCNLRWNLGQNEVAVTVGGRR
jgi:hypothetical protein